MLDLPGVSGFLEEVSERYGYPRAELEEVLAQVDDGPSWPRRVEVEFREPILRGDVVVVCHLPPDGPDGEVRLWVLAGPPGASPTVRTTARAVRLAPAP